MENFYPYSDEEIASASKDLKVKALHSAILLHRQRYKHLNSLPNPNENALQSILVLLKLYGWELAKLDPKYFNENLYNLPAL